MTKELSDITTFSHPKIVNGVNIKETLNNIKEKTGRPVSRVCMDGVVKEIKRLQQLEVSVS